MKRGALDGRKKTSRGGSMEFRLDQRTSLDDAYGVQTASQPE